MTQLLNEIQTPSPLTYVNSPLLDAKELTFIVKRDDLIHESISGNKWRKLKCNLDFAINNKKDTIITFGGAFSNHLYAVAAACDLLKIKSIGILRGELDLKNPTIKFCLQKNMLLIPVSRSAFKEKEKSIEVQQILATHPDALIIPEGGTNEISLFGVSEIWTEIQSQMESMPDYLILSAGTGGTTAGLLISNHYKTKIIAFSALKSEHLEDEILFLAKSKHKEKLFMQTCYHFGGYAKWNIDLLNFIRNFGKDTNIPIDHVYNGKALFGVMDLIKNDYFPKKSTILYLHTGGLQGKEGLEYLIQKN